MSAVALPHGSTVTDRSDAAPKGMSGRQVRGSAVGVPGGAGRGWCGAERMKCAVWCRSSDTNGHITRDRGGTGAEGDVAEVKGVAVRVLAQAREVELAQERKPRSVSAVSPRSMTGARRSVVGDAREQVDEARGRPRGGVSHPGPGASVTRSANPARPASTAGQQPPLAFDGKPLVPEPGRRTGAAPLKRLASVIASESTIRQPHRRSPGGRQRAAALTSCCYLAQDAGGHGCGYFGPLRGPFDIPHHGLARGRLPRAGAARGEGRG